jgi:HEAT repeat protein
MILGNNVLQMSSQTRSTVAGREREAMLSRQSATCRPAGAQFRRSPERGLHDWIDRVFKVRLGAARLPVVALILCLVVAPCWAGQQMFAASPISAIVQAEGANAQVEAEGAATDPAEEDDVAVPAGEVDPAVVQEVDALLGRIPTNSPAEHEALRRDLSTLSAEAIHLLCERLVEPGTGDDSKERMALHGLAFLAADGSDEAMRQQVTKVMRDALNEDHPAAVRAFLIRQLHYVAGPETAGILRPYLLNRELCEPAAQAMISIAGRHRVQRNFVLTQFWKAYVESEGPCRIAIVRALGTLEDTACYPTVLPDMESGDPILRRTAAWALAQTGDPALSEALLAYIAGTPLAERADSIELLLLYSRSLTKLGENKKAAEMLRFMIDPSTADPGYAFARCAALSSLAEVLGEGALDDLMAALGDEDVELQATAARLIAGVPGRQVTARLTESVAQAQPAVQARTLTVLAARGDASALPVVLECLWGEDREVGAVAAGVAAQLGEMKAVEPLIEALAVDDAAYREAVIDALARITHPRATRRIEDALADADDAVQVGLLHVLMARPGDVDLETIRAATQDESVNVRVTAIQAMATLAPASQVDKLVELLASAREEAEFEALQEALVSVASREANTETRTKEILAALSLQPSPQQQIVLLRALGQLGGSSALTLVRQAMEESSSPDVYEAAVRALADWPTGAALEPLMKIAAAPRDVKDHVLALRGVARIAAEEPAEISLPVYREALGIAQRAEEKKLLLSGLGKVKDPAVFEMLTAHLAEAALQAESATAIFALADALAATHWTPAQAAVEQAMQADLGANLSKRGAEVQAHLSKFAGHLTDWLVTGPYTVAGKTGVEIFDHAFAPEPGSEEAAAGGEVSWREQPVDGHQSWRIDLNATMGGGDRAGYLRTYVYSPAAQPARLEVGSDDGIKVWLNGAVVHANNVLRGAEPAADSVEVSLREGWNELLVKVTNNGGGWAACARLRSSDGGALDGVYSTSRVAP